MKLKKWQIILIIVIVIGFFGSMMGGSDDKTSDQKGKDDISTEEEKIYKMKDTVKVGDVEYVVLSKKSTNKVGDQYFDKKAQGQYLVIDISIKNLGNESLNVSDNFFKLYNGDKEFETDSEASIYLGDKSIIYEDVNPDVTLKGQIVFDVSKEIANSNDNILQVQTGAWGTESEKICLK